MEFMARNVTSAVSEPISDECTVNRATFEGGAL